MTNDNTDDKLIAALRARASDPSTRTDSRSFSSRTLRPPATLDLIDAAEESLGFSLHPFLKRLYAEVGNGGFGPGYGLLSLSATDLDTDEPSLPSTYRSFVVAGGWPKDLLPLWDWGDAVWSCVDATSPGGTVVTHDGTAGATQTGFCLRSWLDNWARGLDMWKEIYEDREVTILNPFTKRPVLTKVRGIAKGTPFKASG